MKLKKFSVLILIIIFAIGVTGCMKERKDVTPDILAYMGDKYNDSFAYKDTFGGGVDKKDLQMLLSSEKYPDEDVWISYYEVDGQPVIEDNYLCVKFKQNTTDTLADIVKEVISDEFVVYYAVRPLVHTVGSSGDMSFEEFINEPTSHITFRVAVNSGNIDEIYKENVKTKLEEKLKEYGLCARIGTLYFYENDAYSKVTGGFMENGEEGKEYLAMFKFTMETLAGYRTSSWR